MRHLSLSDNQLSGEVLLLLPTLENVEYFELSNNQLSKRLQFRVDHPHVEGYILLCSVSRPAKGGNALFRKPAGNGYHRQYPDTLRWTGKKDPKPAQECAGHGRPMVDHPFRPFRKLEPPSGLNARCTA